MKSPTRERFDLLKVNRVRGNLARGTYTVPAEEVAEHLILLHFLYEALTEPEEDSASAPEGVPLRALCPTSS
jgi:hypothetical protein